MLKRPNIHINFEFINTINGKIAIFGAHTILFRNLIDRFLRFYSRILTDN